MRERCFSVLGNKVAGARVLDLFAGTGAVGIEALSRGAANVVFVDVHRSSAKLITANLESLGIGRERGSLMIRPAMRAIDELANRNRSFDLIWADPPFESWTDGFDALLAAVTAGLATDDASLCLECPANADLEPLLPEQLVIERDLKGGASRVVILGFSVQGCADTAHPWSEKPAGP
jgi:16S rRNA (guanine966-N2)-methyltransferase